MPICVHLTPEKAARDIKRSGIKAVQGLDGLKGIYCMPVMPNYYASHQWLRELKRGHGQSPLVAVDFRLPRDEIVFVGHYSHPHARLTVSEAASVIMSADDPRGYEIFLPRSVLETEIHKIRSVSQVIGWRFYPDSNGRKPCVCCICRGEYGARKLRDRLNDEESQTSSE